MMMKKRNGCFGLLFLLSGIIAFPALIVIPSMIINVTNSKGFEAKNVKIEKVDIYDSEGDPSGEIFIADGILLADDKEKVEVLLRDLDYLVEGKVDGNIFQPKEYKVTRKMVDAFLVNHDSIVPVWKNGRTVKVRYEKDSEKYSIRARDLQFLTITTLLIAPFIICLIIYLISKVKR